MYRLITAFSVVAVSLLLLSSRSDSTLTALLAQQPSLTAAASQSPTVRLAAPSVATGVPISAEESPTLTLYSTPTLSPMETTPSPTGTLPIEVSPTPTRAIVATRTPIAPTLPMIALQACSEIWQPGYYKLQNDIKTLGQDCFYIQSNNVVFDCDNHTIEGRNFQGYAFFVRKFGFPFLQTPNNVEIKNCRIHNHRTGIFVGGGNNIYIHHNDLSDNFTDVDKRRFGEFLGQSEGGGLRLDTVVGGRVENNSANNSAIGIDLRDSSQIVVRNNTASNNSAWGINLIHTSNSEISNNTVRDNIRWCTWGNGTVGRGCDAGGIIIQDGSSHNLIKGNIVEGDNGNGIFIKAHFMRCDDNNTIQGNKITNAVYNGIELGFCKGNKAIGNEITGSIDGILFGFDSNTEIRSNVISNMNNHGITSWNSRGAIVDRNQIINAREAILFFWDKWDLKQFSFLAPSPDQYASRDHVISNNILRDNAVAAIHLLNSTNNRVTGNTFTNNGRDFWLEGQVQGNIIPALTPGAAVPTAISTRPTPAPIPSELAPGHPDLPSPPN